MLKATSSDTPKSQIDKFKETAKQVETDNSVEHFDRALKKIASQSAKKATAQK